MKKLFIGLAFLGLMAFSKPIQANPTPGCMTCILYCCNGASQHIVVICDWDNDPGAWMSILCHCDND